MRTGYDLPLHVVEAIRRETGGRDVLWYGRPNANAVFRHALLLWLLGVPFLLFSLVWLGSILGLLNPKAEWYGSWNKIGGLIFGLPFLAVGCFGVAAPFWSRWQAAHTGFAITAAGLTVVVAPPGGTTMATLIPFTEILAVDCVEQAHGYGTLKLHIGWERDSDGDLSRKDESLSGIPDARLVEELLRQRAPKAG